MPMSAVPGALSALPPDLQLVARLRALNGRPVVVPPNGAHLVDIDSGGAPAATYSGATDTWHPAPGGTVPGTDAGTP
ncbi:hypothetical protein ACFC1T_08675 [Kitasatospora sp. NPDC056076]|uniref:hypothetical protein n=1 Tax=Kitasatospora sp. NPDC056076 TaxID=3345703 RepID=UPI0035E39ED3